MYSTAPMLLENSILDYLMTALAYAYAVPVTIDICYRAEEAPRHYTVWILLIHPLLRENVIGYTNLVTKGVFQMLIGGINLVRESDRSAGHVGNNVHGALGNSFICRQTVAVHDADGKERALFGILFSLQYLARSKIAEFKQSPRHVPTKGRDCLVSGSGATNSTPLGNLLVIRVPIKARGKDIVGIRMLHQLGFETERLDHIFHDVGRSVLVGVRYRLPVPHVLDPRSLPRLAVIQENLLT